MFARNLSPHVLGVLAACTLLGGAAEANVVMVTQLNLSFSPQNITINVGDTVRWVRTGGAHDVAEGTDGIVNGNEAFFSLLDGGTPVFDFVFDAAFLAANPRPGNKYDYFCSPHIAFGMVGSVTVVGVNNTGSPLCDGSAGNCPCGLIGAVDQGCPNTNPNGNGAKLVGSGHASVSADSFNFLVSDGPFNNPGLILRGTLDFSPGVNTVSNSEGLVCVGGATLRGNVLLLNGSGMTNAGGIFAGVAPFGATANLGGSDYYQFWYRDPASSCNANDTGSSNFNFSNSWKVTWLP